jgi:hypothetical protein
VYSSSSVYVSPLLHSTQSNNAQWGSIESNSILSKALFLISERRFIPASHPLLKIPRRRTALFISIQLIAVAACVAISQTIAAIGFPVLITALIPLRTVLIPRWFTPRELAVLDALTADNPAVLVSFGGTPALMKDKAREASVEERGRDVQHNLGRVTSRQSEQSAHRQRAGSIAR